MVPSSCHKARFSLHLLALAYCGFRLLQTWEGRQREPENTSPMILHNLSWCSLNPTFMGPLKILSISVESITNSSLDKPEASLLFLDCSQIILVSGHPHFTYSLFYWCPCTCQAAGSTQSQVPPTSSAWQMLGMPVKSNIIAAVSSVLPLR